MAKIGSGALHKFINGEIVGADTAPQGGALNPLFEMIRIAHNHTDERVDSIQATIEAGGEVLAVKEQVFIAAPEGQSVFHLTGGQYAVGFNRLRVSVDGELLSLAASQFTELTPTSFQLTTQAPGGALVVATWFQGLIVGETSFLPSTSYTAADVLAKVKSVDGQGSGLDADTVRGYVPPDKDQMGFVQSSARNQLLAPLDKNYQIHAHGPNKNVVMSATASSQLCINCWFDDNLNWQRVDTAKAAYRLRLGDNGLLEFYSAPAGGNPITNWTSRNLLEGGGTGNVNGTTLTNVALHWERDTDTADLFFEDQGANKDVLVLKIGDDGQGSDGAIEDFFQIRFNNLNVARFRSQSFQVAADGTAGVEIYTNGDIWQRGERVVPTRFSGIYPEYWEGGWKRFATWHIPDTRNDNHAPAVFSASSQQWDFKSTSAIGLSHLVAGHVVVHTIRPWTDDSGGKASQIAYDGNGGRMFIRTGSIDSNTWEGWAQVGGTDFFSMAPKWATGGYAGTATSINHLTVNGRGIITDLFLDAYGTAGADRYMYLNIDGTEVVRRVQSTSSDNEHASKPMWPFNSSFTIGTSNAPGSSFDHQYKVAYLLD